LLLPLFSSVVVAPGHGYLVKKVRDRYE